MDIPFASYLEQAGASTITTELALAWATRTHGSESWKAARLSVVRGFARHLRTIDPTAEIPPTGVLIARKRSRSRTCIRTWRSTGCSLRRGR